MTALLQNTNYDSTELAFYAAQKYHLTRIGIVAILADKGFGNGLHPYLLPIVSMNVSECRQALGMQDGIISDGQITASSEYMGGYVAIQARLHFARIIAHKAGSWSAERNDLHQWLQVDVGSHYFRVIRVATQGRHDDSHWVTKYKLEYGNDGEKFHYYRGSGKISDKVM